MSEQPGPPPVTERIPMPSLVGSPVDLPDVSRRARKAATGTHIVQPYTRARVREAQRPGRRPTRRDAASRLPPWLAGNWAAQDAVMLHYSQPRSLSEIWAWHRSCADYYRGAEVLSWLRWVRLAWGAAAVVLAVALYLTGWWTASLARSAATAALIALLVWLL